MIGTQQANLTCRDFFLESRHALILRERSECIGASIGMIELERPRAPRVHQRTLEAQEFHQITADLVRPYALTTAHYAFTASPRCLRNPRTSVSATVRGCRGSGVFRVTIEMRSPIARFCHTSTARAAQTARESDTAPPVEILSLFPSCPPAAPTVGHQRHSADWHVHHV